MIYECVDRRGKSTQHKQSGDLSSKDAMKRLGVYERPFKVTRWPDGRPDLAHCVQQMEVSEISWAIVRSEREES